MKPEMSFSPREVAKKIVPVIPPIFAMGIVGYAFFRCDPKNIHDRLPDSVKPVFDQLLEKSNEKEEAQDIIRGLPDNTERDVVGQIVYIASKSNYIKNKKPHLRILEGLRQLAVSNSNRR